VTVRVFDDRSSAVPIYTKAFALGASPTSARGRLPAGRKSRTYSVLLELGPQTVISELFLASTPLELDRV
jgi:hypothetical protein